MVGDPFPPNYDYWLPVRAPQPMVRQPVSPRTLPVNVPLPSIGVTIVTVDHAGNVTIKVDQVAP